MTLKHFNFLIDIINKKIIENFNIFRLSIIQPQITINKKVSMSFGPPLYLEKLHIISFLPNNVVFSKHLKKLKKMF